jgi:hypothetical protein
VLVHCHEIATDRSQFRAYLQALNRRMQEKVDTSKKTTDGRYIRYVEIAYKQNIYNYRQDDVTKFIKIVSLLPCFTYYVY